MDCCKEVLMICVNSSPHSRGAGLCWSVEEKKNENNYKFELLKEGALSKILRKFFKKD
jgi:hypothetical protein